MHKKVDIIYGKYLSDDGKLTIGGIQTYITDLCKIIEDKNLCCRIVQFSNKPFIRNLSERVTVQGFYIDVGKNKDKNQGLFDAAVGSRGVETILTIFATDTLIPKKVSGQCIAIQHGISWDIPRDVNRPLIRQIASKTVEAYRTVSRLERVNTVVCVDYNFQNWYRTQLQCITAKMLVIPNYSHIAPVCSKPKDVINIIFARRLFAYRGTRIFTEAIKRILKEKTNILVTIAGNGEDEAWMREQLGNNTNVSFITYESHESLEIHKDKHIAVVPTVGSEGTSLSLLEAMSAQCACICTDVGGMTNIVIDGFNGKMIPSGDSERLYLALKELILNTDMRERLSKNGYETVKQGFAKERWRESWKRIICGYNE